MTGSEERQMVKALVVAAELSAAGKAALRQAGLRARELGAIVHVVGATALHGDAAFHELAETGVAVRLHVSAAPLEEAVCAVARAHDALVVSTAASATRVMQLRPPRGVQVVGDDLRNWAPPPGDRSAAPFALAGAGSALLAAALDRALVGPL
jgi:archaeosine-15-forming tRNA-guanine transglycosylase